MEKEKLNLNELALLAKDGRIEIEIREGKAVELLPPLKPVEKVPLHIAGNIGTVAEFLKKRRHLFNAHNCSISVGLMNIRFTGNEQKEYGNFDTNVYSVLQYDDIYLKSEINSDREFDALELSRFLRKRKNLFIDSDQFSKVWAALSAFQAEVQRQITKADDRTGNTANVIKQQVTSNLPKVFTLSLPVFKGALPVTVDIEIDVDPNSLKCSMLCFDIDEKIKEISNELIETELNTLIDESSTIRIRDLCVTYYT